MQNEERHRLNGNWNETRWDWGDCWIEINDYVRNRFTGEMDSAFYLHTTPDDKSFWEALGDTVIILNTSFQSKTPGVCLFPNPVPVNQSFYVVTAKRPVRFTLKDATGTTVPVNSEGLNEFENTLAITSGLSPGVYILEIYFGKGNRSCHKIIITAQ